MPGDAGRKQGFQPRFPQEAIQEVFKSVYCQPPSDCDERELIVVDCNNPVSRTIIAGIWVAFFQRVPAIIVRTGRG